MRGPLGLGATPFGGLAGVVWHSQSIFNPMAPLLDGPSIYGAERERECAAEVGETVAMKG